MRAEARARLLDAIAKARRWLDGLIAGTFTSTAEIVRHERCSERSVRITISLAFLAPAIVRAAIEGRLPYGLTASSFSELPILWRNSCRSQADAPGPAQLPELAWRFRTVVLNSRRSVLVWPIQDDSRGK
jgi:hypothetical protein